MTQYQLPYSQIYPCIALVTRGSIGRDKRKTRPHPHGWWIHKVYNGADFKNNMPGNSGHLVVKYYYPEQPRTGRQQGNKSLIYDGVYNWCHFDDFTKRYYNQLRHPGIMSGYNHYLSLYLKANYPVIIYWEKLERNADDVKRIPDYISSDYFAGTGRISAVASYPAAPPYGAIRYRSDLKHFFGFAEDTGWVKLD